MNVMIEYFSQSMCIKVLSGIVIILCRHNNMQTVIKVFLNIWTPFTLVSYMQKTSDQHVINNKTNNSLTRLN